MAVIPLIKQPTGYLFDRACGTHPWLAALNALQAGRASGHAALAQNWRMDGRVDAAREQHLAATGCFPDDAGGKGFQAAIWEYFRHYQCHPASGPSCAGYADIPNRGNLIPFEEQPARSHRLLHIGSLGRLINLVLSGLPGKEGFLRAWSTLTGYRPIAESTPGNIDRLVSTLQNKGGGAIRQFALVLSDALGDTEPHWWAAFSHEIGALENNRDWTQAVQKTGQGHIEQGEWLIAWRYSPELVGRLYRPSVAEAGDYAFHFPSPPLAPYGITMPLAPGLPAVRELIHAPLKGENGADACIGFGRVEHDPIPANDEKTWFHRRRHEHARMLADAQPAHFHAQAWLQRHALLP
jgi:hypothetical protein